MQLQADAPVNQQSPTLPLDKDEATHNPPPVDETVQSPTDVATESTQNSNPNKVWLYDVMKNRTTRWMQHEFSKIYHPNTQLHLMHAYYSNFLEWESFHC